MDSGQEASTRVALPALLLGVCVAYYLGSLLGMQLRLPPATPSILWPPNALLAAALLLVEPRRWPIVLLAALPAHLVVELQTDWPLALVLALFVTNSLEAVIAAGGVRLLSDSPSRFDTPRRLAALVVAAGIAAPLISSFVDAAAVTWARGEPYWDVWRHRLFANILAELVIVPAVVGVVTGIPRWLRRGPVLRSVEAAALGVGFLATGLLALNADLGLTSPLRAVYLRTPLAVQLPFLLWAAVRFGPTGISVALLTTSVMTAWAVAHGHGPFESMDPNTTTPAVTISLILVATTLMWLATLIEERRQTQHSLGERLGFEELLSRMARAFMQFPSDRIEPAFDASLGRIGAFFDADCALLLTTADAKDGGTLVASWTQAAFGAPLPTNAERGTPLGVDRLFPHGSPTLTGDAVRPIETVVRPALLAEFALRSGYVVPLMPGGRPLGALVFGYREVVAWSAEDQANVRIVAEVLSNALARKLTEDALRASELMKSAILRSLTSGVAVVDRNGLVLAVNESWTRHASLGGDAPIQVGDNLLDACRGAAQNGNSVAEEIASGVSAVIAGTQDIFVIEHRSDADGVPCWWSILVVPLNRPERGAVVTRSDISDLRRAELEAHRSRQALAHVARVATVGELTASLAHQLNQPLTAIMTNAHAARRILASDEPDLAEVREILIDIVRDDRRASDVIQRVRDLLHKGELEMTQVDLVRAIRDVADLVSSEALSRGVTILLDFESDAVVVRGDRVQIQQVILNLLHNGLDAMSGQEARAATIVVRCRAQANHVVEVSVRDSGPGLPVDAEEIVFEPFYTTKEDGMGMGLPIARSIVEAHGGVIHVERDSQAGATFVFTLPLAGVPQESSPLSAAR
jgi:signal transduction histidine kinase/integral membrane sensor domain MASE1